MSIIRTAWALVTGFYLATLVACLLLVVPPIKSHLGEEQAARSARAAVAAAALYSGVSADDPRPLRTYATLLSEAAAAGGWTRFEIQDSAKVVVVPAAESKSGWVNGLVGGWPAAQASAPLFRAGAPLGSVKVWVDVDHADALMERCFWAVLLAFGSLGAVMVLCLAKLAHWASRPLADFEDALQGVSERRFVQLHEPKVSEWRNFASSLNVMVARVQALLQTRDATVQDLQGRLAVDELTKAASRPLFMETLAARLQDDKDGGCVVIVRVHDLDGMNRRVGRSRADELLVAVGTTIRSRLLLAGLGDETCLARLNGSDFALILPFGEASVAKAQLEQISQSLLALAEDGLCDGPYLSWMGATVFRQGETLPAVLMRVDAMLMQAEAHQEPVSLSAAEAAPYMIAVAQWRVLLETALDTGRVELALFPVCNALGELIHHEAMARLVDANGRWLDAAEIVPPAIRNGRISDLDLRVIELALVALGPTKGRLAVNVAAQSLRRPVFLRRLGDLLQRYSEAAPRLALEVDERGFDATTLSSALALRRTVQPFGCHLGIDQFGISLSMLTMVSSVHVDYVKLAPALLIDFQRNPRKQAFLVQLAELGRRVGVQVLANGVKLATDVKLLADLGVTGFSGPAVVEPRQAADQVT